MNYLLALRAFEKACDARTPEEKAAAAAAFDTTMQAQMCKLLDAWTELWDKVFSWR